MIRASCSGVTCTPGWVVVADLADSHEGGDKKVGGVVSAGTNTQAPVWNFEACACGKIDPPGRCRLREACRLRAVGDDSALVWGRPLALVPVSWRAQCHLGRGNEHGRAALLPLADCTAKAALPARRRRISTPLGLVARGQPAPPNHGQASAHRDRTTHERPSRTPRGCRGALRL